MGESIVIKGNRYGLTVQLDEEADFATLVTSFATKLEEGRKFFGSSKISLQFLGKVLNQEEVETMVQTVRAYSDMEVFCVVDEDMPVVKPSTFEHLPTEPEIIKEVITKSVIPVEAAVFHQGTLRSGQEINVDTGIVILGDVNPGAKVTAKGNIFVIGQLKGYAHAGEGGNDAACVFALKMTPTQIRISRVIARSPDKFSDEALEPQIAFLEENRITIDHIDRTIFKHFNLLK